MSASRARWIPGEAGRHVRKAGSSSSAVQVRAAGGGVARMCSLSCCRGRRLGVTPAICASGRLSGAKVRRRPATTSSSRGGSRRRCTPSAVARLTCARLVLPVIALAAFASTRSADGALVGPSFWEPFTRVARATGNESLDRWIAVNGPTIEAEFARRPPRWRRPVDMPLTTAALEQITRPITPALYPRRYALKNRDRLNRLLMLLQLQINGEDDVQAYAKTIRTWLQANGGRPVDQRRAIADPAGLPSVR
jgi:hypothetical protein